MSKASSVAYEVGLHLAACLVTGHRHCPFPGHRQLPQIGLDLASSKPAPVPQVMAVLHTARTCGPRAGYGGYLDGTWEPCSPFTALHAHADRLAPERYVSMDVSQIFVPVR